VGSLGFMSHQCVLLELRRNVSLFYFDLLENSKGESDTRFISGGTEGGFFSLMLRVHSTPGGEILCRLKSTERNTDCESPRKRY